MELTSLYNTEGYPLDTAGNRLIINHKYILHGIQNPNPREISQEIWDGHQLRAGIGKTVIIK